MTEPARLHVVTGEVPDDPVQALHAQLEAEREQRRMLERDIRGYRLRLAQKEAELADKQLEEPHADEIVSVLDPWCDAVLAAGWWTLRPRYKPGDARWKATAAARNKGYDPPYLRQVTVGALFEADRAVKRRKQFERHWLEPQTIFGGFIETHYENAADPRFEWVRKAREVPATLRERWVSVELQGDVCMAPGCNHLRLDHDRPRPLEDVFDPPCAVHGCVCTEFCDTVERWMDGRERMGAA